MNHAKKLPFTIDLNHKGTHRYLFTEAVKIELRNLTEDFVGDVFDYNVLTCTRHSTVMVNTHNLTDEKLVRLFTELVQNLAWRIELLEKAEGKWAYITEWDKMPFKDKRLAGSNKVQDLPNSIVYSIFNSKGVELYKVKK